MGKTSLLKSYATKEFSKEYTTTVFDNYSVDVMVNGEVCNVGIIDTPSHQNYDKLRPMSYNQTDIILVCYSVVKQNSFRSITEKWVPEINFFASKTPFMIVGTQIDLRKDLEVKIKPDKNGKKENKWLSQKQGKKLSKELAKYGNCIGYVECSALTQQGLKTVFDEAIRCVTSKETGDKVKEKGKCYVL